MCFSHVNLEGIVVGGSQFYDTYINLQLQDKSHSCIILIHNCEKNLHNIFLDVAETIFHMAVT